MSNYIGVHSGAFWVHEKPSQCSSTCSARKSRKESIIINKESRKGAALMQGHRHVTGSQGAHHRESYCVVDWSEGFSDSAHALLTVNRMVSLHLDHMGQ